MAKYTCVKTLKANYCTAFPIADASSFGLVKLGSGFTVGGDGSISVSVVPQSVDWDDIENKPTDFPPSAHTHTTTNITGLDTTLSDLNSRLTAIQRTAINALVSPTQDYVDMTEATAAIKSIIDALQAI